MIILYCCGCEHGDVVGMGNFFVLRREWKAFKVGMMSTIFASCHRLCCSFFCSVDAALCPVVSGIFFWRTILWYWMGHLVIHSWKWCQTLFLPWVHRLNLVMVCILLWLLLHIQLMQWESSLGLVWCFLCVCLLACWCLFVGWTLPWTPYPIIQFSYSFCFSFCSFFQYFSVQLWPFVFILFKAVLIVILVCSEFFAMLAHSQLFVSVWYWCLFAGCTCFALQCCHHFITCFQ